MLKKMTSLVLAGVMALSLVACGGGWNENTGNSGSTGDISNAETSDTLTIAVSTDMTSMDPHVGKEIAAVVVTNNIFATLLAKDENGEIIPYVAESWEQVDCRKLGSSRFSSSTAKPPRHPSTRGFLMMPSRISFRLTLPPL